MLFHDRQCLTVCKVPWGSPKPSHIPRALSCPSTCLKQRTLQGRPCPGLECPFCASISVSRSCGKGDSGTWGISIAVESVQGVKLQWLQPTSPLADQPWPWRRNPRCCSWWFTHCGWGDQQLHKQGSAKMASCVTHQHCADRTVTGTILLLYAFVFTAFEARKGCCSHLAWHCLTELVINQHFLHQALTCSLCSSMPCVTHRIHSHRLGFYRYSKFIWT